MKGIKYCTTSLTLTLAFLHPTLPLPWLGLGWGEGFAASFQLDQYLQQRCSKGRQPPTPAHSLHQDLGLGLALALALALAWPGVGGGICSKISVRSVDPRQKVQQRKAATHARPLTQPPPPGPRPWPWPCPCAGLATHARPLTQPPPQTPHTPLTPHTPQTPRPSPRRPTRRTRHSPCPRPQKLPRQERSQGAPEGPRGCVQYGSLPSAAKTCWCAPEGPRP